MCSAFVIQANVCSSVMLLLMRMLVLEVLLFSSSSSLSPLPSSEVVCDVTTVLMLFLIVEGEAVDRNACKIPDG